jgi:RNA polymerase sigma-70 factor, ECF subfamily
MKRVQWNDRAHFYALSARLMRRILVDHGAGARLPEARRRRATSGARRGQAAMVVDLRFFGGLSVKETAEVLQVSRHTVMRDWTLARAWLFRKLRRGGTEPA